MSTSRDELLYGAAWESASDANKKFHDEAWKSMDRDKIIMKTTTLPAIGESWHGGIYAGIARGEEGQSDHHLILLADKPAQELSWQDAMAWAESVGGSLPTHSQSTPLYANLRDLFCISNWHWTATMDYDGWVCIQHFSNGYKAYSNKVGRRLARAVRRINF